uniref:Uncharacterized protein n=1 Tax=Candidatus Kentrum sp. FW TaxID=2126338 RepID=A0A450TK45_9GAMM|nr:MAG: hypothetical protein BECKFW1821C_GA0114237_101323 [Candidatus Kentron sp. FW]
MLFNGQIIDDGWLDQVFRHGDNPVILACANKTNPDRLNAHTLVSRGRRSLKRKIGKAFSREGIRGQCDVIGHNVTKLLGAGSLRDLIAPFGDCEIVYDPTASFGRARTVVRCADALRRQLATQLHGVYLDPWRRTLFVVLDPTEYKRGGDVTKERLAETERLIGQTVSEEMKWQDRGFRLDIRIGFDLPHQKVLPVDVATAARGRARISLFTRLRARSTTTMLAAVLGTSAAAAVADGLPAVSAPNAKLAIAGGGGDSGGKVVGDGSVTFPIGERYGAQIDAMLGEEGSNTVWGVAGQGFWRRPEQGLIGVFGGHAKLDDEEVNRVGATGEIYKDQFTYGGYGGYQFGDADDDAFLGANVRWYNTDNFYVSVGGEITPDLSSSVGGVEAEYMPAFSALPGLSLFANASRGEEEFASAMVGMRYYFGPKKSLIRRHREDDPPSFFGSIGGAGSIGMSQAANVSQNIKETQAAYGG